MSAAPHAQRMNVLGRAFSHGWAHDMATYDEGNIIRDQFVSELGVIRAVWLRTPWSDSGRWAGSVFSEKATKKDRNVWKVSGKGGLLDVLSTLTASTPT